MVNTMKLIMLIWGVLLVIYGIFNPDYLIIGNIWLVGSIIIGGD